MDGLICAGSSQLLRRCIQGCLGRPDGTYAYVWHPQYGGLTLVMLGFLVQWSILLTLAMFPVLVFLYTRLARTKEREAINEFGATYERYAHDVPGFILRLRDLFGATTHRQA